MKYEITLLTGSGPITECYTDNHLNESFETLAEFENRMFNKYGQFVMLKAIEI